jgi:tetratricopeptide (TPR) repeat protein
VVLNNLGNVALAQGEHGKARVLVEESITIQREIGDKWGLARSLYHLGEIALDRGDLEAARRLYEECLWIRRGLGDKWGAAECLKALAAVASGQDQVELAAQLFGAAEEMRESVNTFPASADRVQVVRR